MSTKKLSGRKKAAATASRPRGYAAAVRAASSSKTTLRERVSAFTELAGSVCDDDDAFQNALAVLRDREQSTKVRNAAISAIQAGSFSSPNFKARRPAYFAALRSLIEDPETDLRHRALGILSRSKDGKAQEVLLRGLEKPEQALVSPDKALQLLRYDPKAEAYSVARKMVDNPPNEPARHQAMRLLAADAKSAPMFESILRDKKEVPEARQIAAAALHSVAPDTFQKYARKIVLDVDEDLKVQATSLAALANFGNENLADDKELTTRVRRLEKSKTPAVKRNAKLYRRRYSR